MPRFALLAGTAALLAACSDPAAVGELEMKLAAAQEALAETEQALSETRASLSEFETSSGEAFDLAEAALATASSRASAQANVIGRDGEAIGEGIVIDGPHGMLIRLQVMGLPQGFHGVHLHQVANCDDAAEGFKASGGHINIGETEHGVLNTEGFHTGADFPNIWAGGDMLMSELRASGLVMADAMDDDGFALIIHENEDDHVTQPIGGAGARLACAAFR